MKIDIEALAFQQQDKILGACASIAIWSLLQKVCVSPNHQMSSVGQITKRSGIVDADGHRLIPTRGLDRKQIATIVASNGLQPEMILGRKIEDPTIKTDKKIITTYFLKKIVNAYYRLGIPMLLGFEPSSDELDQLHAVAVCGHANDIATTESIEEKRDFLSKLKKCLSGKNKVDPSKFEISWKADTIIKLYAHDDRWGPYSRIEFLDDYHLSSAWSFFDNKAPGYALHLIVGTPSDIITPYTDIENIIIALNDVIESILQDALKEDLVWDLYVQKSSDFKEDLRDIYLTLKSKQGTVLSDKDIDYIQKITFPSLSQSLPNYIWRASCHISQTLAFDIILDTTTPVDHCTILNFLPYYTTTNEALLLALQQRKLIYNSNAYRELNYLKSSYINNLFDRATSYQSYY